MLYYYALLYYNINLKQINTMKKIHLISTLIGLLAFSTISKADLKVVTSIKPIHSLASYIMDGVGSPGLIVDGYNSPHNFQLKPSHAKMLEQADIIFWVGEDLENFLEKPLDTIVKKAEKIELLEIKGIKKLKFRERNIFEEHEGHDDHGHDAKKEEHDDHEGHNHGEYDAHIWLDPINAKVILFEMSKHLIELDAKNESVYRDNLSKAYNEIDKLTKDVTAELDQSVASIVFHDAYQYFEKRFNVNVLGAFTVNTDVMPGAEQLAEIREIIEHDKVSCVFSEPQFNPDIIKAVAKDIFRDEAQAASLDVTEGKIEQKKKEVAVNSYFSSTKWAGAVVQHGQCLSTWTTIGGC